MPATSPTPSDKRPGPGSHASGDEDDEVERRSLLAPEPIDDIVEGPGSAAAKAAALALQQRPPGPDLFVMSSGRHQPICSGNMTWVKGGDDTCDMTWLSALVRAALSPPRPSATIIQRRTGSATERTHLRHAWQMVLLPVSIWIGAVAGQLWGITLFGKLLCLLTITATTAAMAFLAAANLTEPGVLPTTLVDDETAELEAEAPRGSGGWYMGMAPPTAPGQNYRILVRSCQGATFRSFGSNHADMRRIYIVYLLGEGLTLALSTIPLCRLFRLIFGHLGSRSRGSGIT